MGRRMALHKRVRLRRKGGLIGAGYWSFLRLWLMLILLLLFVIKVLDRYLILFSTFSDNVLVLVSFPSLSLSLFSIPIPLSLSFPGPYTIQVCNLSPQVPKPTHQ